MENGRPKNIFIVDDDPMLTVALTDYLTRKVPHHVQVFHTGEECLQHLNEGPNIIILDYYLNSVKKNAADGIEIVHFIKLNYPKIRIIMLSSLDKHRTVTQTLEQGAEKFVYKDEHAFSTIAQLINE